MRVLDQEKIEAKDVIRLLVEKGYSVEVNFNLAPIDPAVVAPLTRMYRVTIWEEGDDIVEVQDLLYDEALMKAFTTLRLRNDWS